MGATVDLGTLRVGLETNAAAFAPAMQAAAAGLAAVEVAAAKVAPAMRPAAQATVDWMEGLEELNKHLDVEGQELRDLADACGVASTGAAKVADAQHGVTGASDKAAASVKKQGGLVKDLFGRDPPGQLFHAIQGVTKNFGAMGTAAGEAARDIVFAFAGGGALGAAIGVTSLAVTALMEHFKDTGAAAEDSGEAMRKAMEEAQKGTQEAVKGVLKLQQELRILATAEKLGISHAQAAAMSDEAAIGASLAAAVGRGKALEASAAAATAAGSAQRMSMMQFGGGAFASMGPTAAEKELDAALKLNTAEIEKLREQLKEAGLALAIASKGTKPPPVTPTTKASGTGAAKARGKMGLAPGGKVGDQFDTKTWDDLGQEAVKASQDADDAASNMQSVSDSLDTSSDAADDAAGASDKAAGFWSGLSDDLDKWASADMGISVPAAEEAAEAAGTTSSLFDTASGALMGFINPTSLATSAVSWLGDAIKGAIDALMDLFWETKTGAYLQSKLAQGHEKLVGIVDKATEGLAATAYVAGDLLDPIFKQLFGSTDAMLPIWRALFETVKSMAMGFLYAVGAIKIGPGKLQEAFGTIVAWIGSILSDDLERAGQAMAAAGAATVREGMQAFADAAKIGALDFDEALAAAREEMDALAEATDAATESMTNVPRGFAASSWRYRAGSYGGSDEEPTGFAAGGIVTSPTFAMLGEAGPEAVIPLKHSKGLPGGVSVTIGTVVLPGVTDFEAFLREMERRARVQRFSRQGSPVAATGRFALGSA